MELEETLCWLEIAEGSNLVLAANLGAIKHETSELIAIAGSQNSPTSAFRPPLSAFVCMNIGPFTVRSRMRKFAVV
jgi:hypothetical protein